MMHIDDEIRRVRQFIQELNNVREVYFKELCDKVLNSEYKNWHQHEQFGEYADLENDLLDYIFDDYGDLNYMSFADYLTEWYQEKDDPEKVMIDGETHNEFVERVNSVNEEIKGQTYMPFVDEYNTEENYDNRARNLRKISKDFW
tara:strand:- start:126629 stop:127063 length:435 start_codon:yes stop_codon:yes gene_type:complete